MSSNDFKPGLEGIVAVETEIMEPDREGGMLRYRGVDVEPLIGKYPYENVWGLLVDDDIDSRMPLPEPFEPVGLTGHAPADLQAQTARLSGLWDLGKLNEISDEQARADLGRISGQMMSIVASSARLADGHTDDVPADVVAKGKTAAERFLLQWRGEADPRAAQAIDTYWICTAEHGLNASTFTARVVASTGADCGAALSAAVGALSGPLHGGAPAYVKPMLEEVAAMGDPDKWVRDTLDSRQADHGIRPPRLPRGRPTVSDPQADRARARVAADRDCGAARDRGAGRARAAQAGPAAEDQRGVLLGSRPRHRRGAASARTGDVRLLARRGLVGAHPRAEAHGTPVPAVGALRRPGSARAAGGLAMKSIAAVLLGLLLAGSLAACGSSMHTSTSGSTANAQAQIRSAYEQLFSPQTSLADRVAVLQDGSKFKSVIAGFASNPLAKKVTVDVSKGAAAGRGPGQGRLHRQVRRDVAPDTRRARPCCRTGSGRWDSRASASSSR